MVLRALSRSPREDDYTPVSSREGLSSALELLRREYSDLSLLVRSKRVLDFGCGVGRQSVALAMEEGCHVCGVDTNHRWLQHARALAAEHGIDQDRLMFVTHVNTDMEGTFDVAISKDSMEHFADPISILDQLKRLIHPGGKILITFGPPWFAPYGSHMNFFCKAPWLNVLFSERTVMSVRAAFRNDGATRYEDVESGLNKMTIAKFDRIVANGGLVVQRRKFRCVRGLNWLGQVPIVREFFVNHITCLLTLPDKGITLRTARSG